MNKRLLAVLIAALLPMMPVMAADQVSTPVETAQASVIQVNINTASADELAQLKGIGESKALAIIEYRNAHGKFNDIEELTQVKGIGTKLLEQNRASLSL